MTLQRMTSQAFAVRGVRTAVGVALGAVLGLAYQHFVGCRTGTCLITARWWTATLYGAFVGALLVRSRRGASPATAPSQRWE